MTLSFRMIIKPILSFRRSPAKSGTTEKSNVVLYIKDFSHRHAGFEMTKLFLEELRPEIKLV